MKLRNLLLTFAASFTAATVLMNSDAVFCAAAEAVKSALANIVPSLMPFMTVACFISESACGDVVSRLLRTPVRILFKLPECCAKTVILSMLGGYPCGARILTDMLERKEIDTYTAQRMLCFCINASPAYVITAIGVGVLGSAKIGAIIYFAHIFTAVIMGFFSSRTAEPSPLSTVNRLPRPAASRCFVKAVYDSTTSMLYISGFAVTFSVILALLNETGITAMLTSAINTVTKNSSVSRSIVFLLFDVVTGSNSCAECPPVAAVVLCAAGVSLGGMSIWFQVAFILDRYKIKLSRIVLYRLIHSVLTAGAVYIIIKITDTEVRTSAACGAAVQMTSDGGMLSSVVFVICCVFFVAAVDGEILRMKKRCKNEV